MIMFDMIEKKEGGNLAARIVDKSYKWIASRGKDVANINSKIPNEIDQLIIIPTFVGGVGGIVAFIASGGYPGTTVGLIVGALETPFIARLIIAGVGELGERLSNKGK